MDEWLDQLSQTLGLQGTALLVVLVIVSQLCRLVAKLIPDDSTGWRHYVRIVCAWIGLYVNNRISKGVTTPEAIKDVGRLAQAANTKANLANDQLEDATTLIRAPDGKFTKIKSPWFVGVLAVLLALSTMGCTDKQRVQVQVGVNLICTSASVAQNALNQARQSQTIGVVDKILLYLNTYCPLIRLAVV